MTIGGTSGNGGGAGDYAAGGAGINSNGTSSTYVANSGGLAFINGGIGGDATNSSFGGFGGGGGTNGSFGGGGGGGGYSGGAGVTKGLNPYSAGGGGGSYAINSMTQNGYNTNHGALYVTANFTIDNIAQPTLSWSNMTKDFGDSPFIITAPSSNSSGAFTYSSSNPSVAKVSNTRNALNFDGGNDAINFGVPAWVNSTQFRNTLTIECWFKTTDTNNQDPYANFVSRWITGGVNAQFMFGMNATGQVRFWADGLDSIQSTLSYKDTQWHHAAITYNSIDYKLYIDGVIVNTLSRSSSSPLLGSSTARLIVGNDDAGFIDPLDVTDRQFRGSIADVRIWNVVRTPTEIFNNYAIQLNGDETGLVLYNKLDQGIPSGNNSGLNSAPNNMVSGGTAGILVNFALSGSTSNWVSGPEPRISIIGAGTTLITANQAASGSYASGYAISTLTVNKSNPIIGLTNITKSRLDPVIVPSSNPLSWMQLGQSIIGNGASHNFGWSVSTSADGSVVAMSARHDGGNGPSSGHVRVYKYNGSSWIQLGGNIEGEAGNDESGISVSLSSDGTIVAIGAFSNDGNAFNSGHVRVYKYDITKTTAVTDQLSVNFGPVGWRRLGADIDGEALGDYSGYNVSLSSDGTTVAIGAVYNDGVNGTDSGHVRVYKYDATKTTAITDQSNANFGPVGWRRLGADIDGEASLDTSGFSVSLSSDGTIVAIGAHANDGNGNNSGHVRVYKYDATKTTAETDQLNVNFGPVGWRRLGADIDGETSNDESGWSVSISADGTVLAIGAISNDANGDNSGHVRVYKYDVTKTTNVTDQSNINFGPVGWRRLGADIDGEATNDNSGYSVSLSADGTVVAIGGRLNEGANRIDSGHVRIYKYDATKTTAITDQSNANFGPIGWTRLGIDIDGQAQSDFFGQSVSLSSDGTVVAIGAIYSDSNGADAGRVTVYSYGNYLAPTSKSLVSYGSHWTKLGDDIDGEAANDQSGFSLSMSADGSVVAIGANLNDGSGTNNGHVRVYKYNGSAWTKLGQDIDGGLPVFEATTNSGYRDWYSISISSTGEYQTAVVYGGNIWTSSNYGVSWTERATVQNWQSVSISSSGQYQTAVSFVSGNIYTSSDYGVSWTVRNMPGLWSSVSLSSGGDYQTAVISNGNIYISSNYGVSWTSINISKTWTSVSLSSTGQYQTASATGSGVYVSSNYGASWTENTYTPSSGILGMWLCVSISSTGQYQSAGSNNGNIYTSSDYGVIWTGRTSVTDSCRSISVSSTGQYQTAVSFIGYIFTSSDYGVSWTQRDISRRWNTADVSISSTGQYQTITSTFQNNNGIGLIYFSRDYGITWSEYASYTVGVSVEDNFGTALSLSADGTIVAIGATGFDTGLGVNSGLVRVYKYNGSVWNKLGSDINASAGGDQFGSSVSLSADGTILAIGAPSSSKYSVNGGYTQTYKYDGKNWIKIGSDVQGLVDEKNGSSVSLSSDGKVLAIGSSWYDAAGVDSGVARIYSWDGTYWIQMGGNINGLVAGDNFGACVSLSGDGKIVAISAPYNDANTGISHYNFGQIRVFKYNGTSWNQLGGDIYGDEVQDVAGLSISLSTDGTVLAIGIPYSDVNTEAAMTRVYRYDINKTTAITDKYNANFGPVGWSRIGPDIIGEANYNYSGRTVSLSSDGTIVAIGALANTNNNGQSGHVRVYKIDSYGNYTYTSSNTSVAEVYGSIILARGPGTSTITSTQSNSLNYTAATTTRSLTITTIQPTITWSSITKYFNVGNIVIANDNAPVSNSYGKFKYIQSSDTTTATITDSESDIYDSVVVTLPAARKAIDVLMGKNLQRLFRYVGSSLPVADFHTACDNQGPTLTVVKAANGAIALAFASESWTYNIGGAYTHATIGSCWLCPFQTSSTATPNTKLYYNFVNPSASIYNYYQLGPTFGGGHDLQIGTSYYTNPNSYQTPPNGLFNNGTGNLPYTLASVEIYKLKNEPLITFLKAGTVTLTGSQYASGDYASQNFTTQLTILESTITGTNNMVSLPYNGSAQTATVISNIQPPGATYSGSLTATGTNIGTYTTTITGTSPYTGTVSGTLTITAINSSFNWYTSAITKTYLDPQFTLDAPTGANSAGAFTYTSYNSSVASVDPNTGVVTIGIVGSAIITITQAANGNYLETTKPVAINVVRADPTITSWNAVSKTLGDASFLITPPSSNSPGALTYYTQNNNIALVSTSEIYNSIIVTLPTAKTAIHNLVGQDLKLLFRYVGDKLSSVDFHTACDGQGPTLTVVKATNGAIALAYSSVSFTSSGNYVSATNGSCWLCPFQTSDTATPNTTRYYNSIYPQFSILDNNNYGPIFGNGYDLVIGSDYYTNPVAYQASPNGLFNNGIGQKFFTLSSIEIYRLGSISPTVNIFNSGTTNIRLDQAETANFSSKTVFAQLIISEPSPSSLSNFSSITRLISDGSFLMPPPTSNSTTRHGSLWKKLGNNIIGEAELDFSGHSVSLSADGKVVAIGAYMNDGTTGNVNDNRGHVRVYYWNESAWIQRGIDIDGEAPGDASGWSVKLSANGKVLAIGAVYNDGNSGNSNDDRGSVRVFFWNESAWVQRGGDIDGELAGDNAAFSIDLSGDGTVVAIGAPNQNTSRGSVRIYKYDASKTTADTDQSSINFGPIGWRRLGADIDGEATADHSGVSISLSLIGTTVAIGAYLNNNSNGSSSGHVRVYKYNVAKSAPNSNGPAGWDKIGGDIDGEATNYNSGRFVCISADGEVVSIVSKNSINSGYVRVYKYNENKTTADSLGPARWDRLGADINGEFSGDYSGFSMSMSADGNTIAISSLFNDGPRVSDVNHNCGQVRVYKYNSLKTIADTLGPIGWNRIGADIDGETPQFPIGHSISLSSDGKYLAITCSSNNNHQGYTSVYYIDTYGSFSYSSNLTGVAEVFGSIVLMKSSNTTNIVATQSANVSTYLYPYTSHTFTSAGLNGKNGPTLTQIRTAYASTIWASNSLYLNMKTQGYQLWTVPATGVYELTVAGAAGNGCLVNGYTQPGGRGAVISMRVELVQGQQIGIIVGQKGVGATTTDASGNIGSAGGGGSFVWNASNINNLIAAAGGGGGACYWNTTSYPGGDATYTTTGGSTIGGQTIAGGENGNGGTINSGGIYYSGAGGGWLTSGQSNTDNASNATGGGTFSNGFIGGTAGTNNTVQSGHGGFGGGGGAYNVMGGGGGGYSGGASAGSNASEASIAGGGGGGSYFSGTHFTNVGYNTDSGYVSITSLISNYSTNTISRSLTIDDANSPNLVFDSFSTTVNYGSSSFTVSATSNSSGAITFSTNDDNVATITNGNTVNIIGAGTVDIIATQVAFENFASKIIAIELTVSPILPQISASDINKVFNDAPFRITASSSDSTGTFTYTSNNTSIATVSDTNLITILAHGTTSIRATISATTNYTSHYYDIPLFVDRDDPTITIDPSYLTAEFNDAETLIVSVSNSNGARTYSSSNTNVATVTSNNNQGTVTIHKIGTTTITVSQEQSGNYKAFSADFTFTVLPSIPSILGFPAINKNFQDADYILDPPSSGSSLGEYSFETVPSSTDVLTITPPPTAYTINMPSTPTLSLTDFPNLYALANWRLVVHFNAEDQSGQGTTRALIGSMYNNVDTASGWGLWLSSNDKLIWSWSDNTFDTDFTVFPDTNYSVIVKKQNQYLNIILTNLETGIEENVSTAIGTHQMGQGPVSIGGWANNSNEYFVGTISYVYARDISYIATVGQAGTIQLKAIQQAYGNYTSREVVAPYTVNPISPNINSFGPITKNYKDPNFTITATSASNGAFTYTSSTPGVASIGISTGEVVVGIVGQTTIRATQSATRNYISTYRDETLNVQKIQPSFNFFNAINKNFGDSSFTVSVSLAANSLDSSGAITYSSSDTSVANLLREIGISTFNGNYILNGNTLSYNPTINLIRGLTYNFNINASGHPFWIKTVQGTGTGNSYNNGITNNGTESGIIQFKVPLDAPSTLYYNCQFHGSMQGTISISDNGLNSGTSTNTVILGNAGTTTITATQAESDNYAEGYISTTLTVSPILPTFNPFNQINKVYLDAPFTVSATSNSSGVITYSIINDTTIASVVSSNSVGTVTILKAGTTTIKATQAALGNYVQHEITTTLFVDRAVPTWQTYVIPSTPYGNAPFPINNPISNSNAPFEYSSSNTSVASITTNGILTTHSLGDTTISVTQLLNNNFVSKSGSALLTVTIGTPQISTLALPYTILDNPPFVIPFPVSNAPTSYGTWTKVGGNINGERINDLSGWTVSLSADGNVVAIGAPDNTGFGSKTLSGHVRVYKRNPSKLVSNTLGPIGWDRVGGDIDGEFANSRSGWSVKLSADGNVVATGAPYNDGTTGVSTHNSGSVRVFRYDPNKLSEITDQSNPNFGPINWTRMGTDIDGVSAEDLSGSSVDISADGSIIAIGSPGTNIVNETNLVKGQVRVFKFSGSSWTQLGTNIEGQFDYEKFGTSVSLSADGRILAVGAMDNSNNGERSGETRIYTYLNNNWVQYGQSINGEAPDDNSGQSVAISSDGRTLAIGAPYSNLSEESFSNGSVKIYRYNPADNQNPWQQIGNTIYGESAFDNSGFSVSLSADGNMVVIGGPSNDGTSTNIEDNRGSVRVYYFTNNQWTKIGDDIDGETANDKCGYSVSIASNGRTIAIGSPYKNGSGSQSGHVRVYSVSSEGTFTFTSSNPTIVSIYGTIAYVNLDGTCTITTAQSAVTNYFVSTTKDTVFTVGLKSPTISPLVLATPKTYGEQDFQITQPTSNSTGAFSYVSLDTSIATVSGNTISIVKAGSVVIRAIQASQPHNYAAAYVEATLVINKADPNLDAFSFADKVYLNGPFTITQPTSIGPGSFVYTSNLPIVSINGSTITINAAGTCIITATKQETDNYLSKSISATLVIQKANPSFSFFIPFKRVGDPDFTLSATSNNNETSILYSSSDSNIVSINGLIASIHDGGFVNITASQIETDNFNSGSVSYTLIVIGLDAEYPNQNLNGFNLSNSNLFSANFSSASMIGANLINANLFDCNLNNTDMTNTLLSGVISGNIQGTPILPVDYNLIDGYIIGPNVNLINAHLVGSDLSNNKLIGANLFNSNLLTADLRSIFIDNLTDFREANLKDVVSENINGTTTLFSDNINIVSGKIIISPTITHSNPLTKTYKDQPFDIISPVSDSIAAFTYESSNPSVVSISGSTITINNQGTATITATQPEQSNYATGIIQWTLTVQRALPIIQTFTIPSVPFGTATTTITDPVSESSGQFTYTILEPEIATVEGNVITINRGGTCTVQATQALDGNFLSKMVSTSFTINPVLPNIGIFSIPTSQYLAQPFRIVAPSTDSFGDISYESDNTNIASISDVNLIEIHSAGTCNITLTQAATYNHLPRSVSTVLTVNKIAPQVGTLNLPNDKRFGYIDFALTDPITNSTGAFTFTSSNESVVSISGNMVTINSAGTSTITATQATDTNYTEFSVSAVLTILEQVDVLRDFVIDVKYVGDADFQIVPPSTFRPGNFTYVSSNESVATISGDMITIVNSGITYITATQEPNGIYNAISITTVLTVLDQQTPLEFNNVNLSHINWVNANISDMRILNSNVSHANILGGYLFNTTIINSDLSHSNFLNANLTNASLENSNLSNAIFDNTNLTNTNLTGTLLLGLVSKEIIGIPTLPSEYIIRNGYIIGPSVVINNAILNNANIFSANLTNINLSTASLLNVVSGNIKGIPQLPPNYVVVNGYIIGSSVNLNHADLGSMNLSSLNMSNSNLLYANLINTNLQNTNMDGCNFTDVLSGGIVGTPLLSVDYLLISGYIVGPGVGLINANLKYANLFGANLTNVNLLTAELEFITTGQIKGAPQLMTNYSLLNGYIVGPNVMLQHADLMNSDLSNLDLTYSNLMNANVNNCNLSTTNLTKCNIHGIISGGISGTPLLPNDYTIINQYIIGPSVNLTNADLSNGNLYGVNLTNVDLTTANLDYIVSGSVLGNPQFQSGFALINGYILGPNVLLQNAALNGLSITNINLIGANLHSANLYGATFNNITIDENTDLTNADVRNLNSVNVVGNTSKLSNNVQIINGSIKITPNISNLIVSNKTYGDNPFDITDPTSDSLGIFNYISSNTLVASISNRNRITVVGAGHTVITATQGIYTNYIEGSVSADLTISKRISTMGNLILTSKLYTDPPFNLDHPTTNSTGQFVYTSGNISVATINGSTVSLVGVGQTIIRATQLEDNNNFENFVEATLHVAVGPPTIQPIVIPQKLYGDAPFAITVDPQSNSAGAFTYTSSNLKVATISGRTITITGAGTTTITATQQAYGPYVSGSIQISFNVGLNGLTHSVISNKQLITGLDGSAPTSGVFYIPPYINGLDVAELSNNVFKDKTGFTSFVLPNTLTSIYTSAFEGCTGLTTINLPSSLTYLADSAFKGCTSLTSISIPDKITNLKANLFNNCTSLETVILTETTVIIETNAFLGCTSLKSLNSTKQLTTIGASAFKNCNSLKLFDLGVNITTISANVFENCVSLQSFVIPGSITNIQTNACKGCSGITGSVSIPPSVSTIASGAFDGCNAITEFVFLNNYVNTISLTFTNVNTVFKAIAITTGWSGISINGVAVITSNNLSGVSLIGANLASKDFTNINISNVDLSGSNLSGVVFSPNTNLSGTNFSNVNIQGADISRVTFEPLQKLQLLKNANNREINQIIIPNISGDIISSSLKDKLASNISNAVFDVIIPNANTPFIPSSKTTNGFYIPLFDGETININGVLCFSNINGIYNNQTKEKVDSIIVNNRRFTLYTGSVVGVNNPLDTYLSGGVYMSDILTLQNYKSKWNTIGNDINRTTGNVNIANNLQVSGLFRGNLVIPNKNDITNPVPGQLAYDNTGKLYIFNNAWLSVQLST
jgi:uncharacterized protein YjbI with pentapeptide repeats